MNAMTLSVSMHRSFEKFRLALEPMVSRDIQTFIVGKLLLTCNWFQDDDDYYKVHVFETVGSVKLPEYITLTSKEKDVALPNRDIIRAHFSIAKILQVSGIGLKIDQYWERWVPSYAATDGSTDLGMMLSRKLLIGI
jgi:hypothetical protein